MESNFPSAGNHALHVGNSNLGILKEPLDSEAAVLPWFRGHLAMFLSC